MEKVKSRLIRVHPEYRKKLMKLAIELDIPSMTELTKKLAFDEEFKKKNKKNGLFPI